MTKLFLIGIVVFVLLIVLDLLWFRVAGNFFKSEVGSIARLAADGTWNIRLPAALLAYLFMTLGIMTLVLPRVSGIGEGLLFGALFGLITYAVYDLTNLATLTAWTIRFAIVDMVWGMLLNAVVTTIVALVFKLWR